MARQSKKPDPALSWTYPDPGSGRARTVTFDVEFGLIGERAGHLLCAAKRANGTGRPSTIHHAVYAVKRIAASISKLPADENVQGWATAYENALRSDPSLEDSTRFTYCAVGLKILNATASTYGQKFRHRNPFERKDVSTKPLVHGTALDPLIAAARSDVLAITRALTKPDPAHQSFIDEARRLFAKGIPVRFEARGRRGPGDRLARVWYRATHLPLQDLTIHLYPSSDQLTPFLLLLSLSLAANPDSLSLLQRSGVTPIMHPSQGPLLELDMKKPRSGEIPQRLVRDAGTLSEGWLLRTVLKMTAPLLPIAQEENANYVFLCSSGNMKHPVQALRGGTRARAMQRYVKTHDLPKTTLKQLRAARLTDEWIRTRDPLRIWRMSGSASLGGAAAYVLNYESANADAVAIANIQRSIAADVPDASRELEAKTAGVLATHTCLNVFDTSKPKDRHGFCASFLWPFNDVHFILPLEPRPVAFLLRDYLTLCEAQKALPEERFNAVYAIKKRLIESEYLPLIDDDLKQQAMAIVATLPAQPSIGETL